ncbi:hypothetical protein PG994_008968 [Apiospora phragmitis]|uniref:Uncharacterized protein n=1 Tax=Apiospora phragmitis TaxID=2905665 RepID=A0ABR1UKC9_9PEZI
MESLKTFPVTHPFLSAAVAVAAPLLALLYADYRAYVAMGPHGLPDNLQGYITQLKMRRVSRRDTTVPAPYEDAADGKTKATSKIRPGSGEGSARARRSFLLPAGSSSSSGNSSSDNSKWELTARPVDGGSGGGAKGSSRPRLCHFVAPQRQLEACATEAMKRDMSAFLDALAAANGDALLRGLSRLEGDGPRGAGGRGGKRKASTKAAAITQETRGEILHVHPGRRQHAHGAQPGRLAARHRDGLGRAAPAERWGMLPWGYTLVYAPRDEYDLAVWKKLAVAAMRYCATEGVRFGCLVVAVEVPRTTLWK